MQRKPLTKFKTHYDKYSPESRHRRDIPQDNKSHIQQTHSKHYPQWLKLESISSKIRNKRRVPTLTTATLLEILATAIREEKEEKGSQDEKIEVNFSQFSDDVFLYIENPKDASRKELELINESSKFKGYKMNTQKSLAFLYSNNEKREKK